MIAAVGFLLSMTLLQVQPDATLLRGCENEVGKSFSDWRLAPIRPDVAEFAKENGQHPTTVSGDFDGDSRQDVALFIQSGPFPVPEDTPSLDTMHIAVCLNTARGMNLHVISRPYCGDGIVLSPKGRRYYDFATEEEGTHKLDGVHVYCFEKAGATYELEDGEFRRIIDSD